MTKFYMDIEVAKLISNYYQFPLVVMLLDLKEAKQMLKGTRKEHYGRACEKLERIKEIMQN